MGQYFTNDPELDHEPFQFDFELLGHRFHFTSDRGVFSRHTVDYGSRVLIEAVAASPLHDGPILDVGTGYGPIGLALAKHFPDRQVVMSDVNERALGLASANAAANHIENIRVVASSVYDAITDQFGTIVTNPPIRAGKQIVSAIISGAFSHLLPGGQLFVVIQKKQGAPSALKLMQEFDPEAKVIKKAHGYYILKAQK